MKTQRKEEEQPLKPGKKLSGTVSPEIARWKQSNARPQKQDGYVVATVRLPLGDITSRQARALAELARKYTGEHTLCLDDDDPLKDGVEQ